MADNQANLQLNLNLGDSVQTVYNQVRQMLDDLAARANITLNMGQGGGGGGSYAGGGPTASPGSAGAKARVMNTVTPSAGVGSPVGGPYGTFHVGSSGVVYPPGTLPPGITAQAAQNAAFSASRGRIPDVQALGRMQSAADKEEERLRRTEETTYFRARDEDARRTETHERQVQRMGRMQSMAEAEDERRRRSDEMLYFRARDEDVRRTTAQENAEQRMGRMQAAAEREDVRRTQAKETAERRMQRMMDAAALEDDYRAHDYDHIGRVQNVDRAHALALQEERLRQSGSYGRGRGGYMGGMFRTYWGAHMIGTAAVQAVDRGLHEAEYEVMNNRPDRMGDYQAYGQLGGGVVGGLIGGFLGAGNPLAIGIGANLGGQLGGSVSRLLMAPQALQISTTQDLLEMGRVRAGLQGFYGLLPPEPGAGGPPIAGTVGGRGTLPVLVHGAPSGIVEAQKLSQWINGVDGSGNMWPLAGVQITHKEGILDKIRNAWEGYADFLPDAKAVSSAYSSIASGILQAGFDPMMTLGDTVDYEDRKSVVGYRRVGGTTDGRARSSGRRSSQPFDPDAADYFKGHSSASNSMVQNIIDSAGFAIADVPIHKKEGGSPDLLGETQGVYEPIYKTERIATAHRGEEFAKFLTYNAAYKTGMSVDEAGKALGPMLSDALARTTPQDLVTNGAAALSAADLLTKFGPEKASLMYEAFARPGETPYVTAQQLRQAQMGLVHGQSEVERAGLLARGSADAVYGATNAEMSALDILPDARKSTAYMKLAAQRRSALEGAFQQQDTTAYDIPLIHLKGQQERLQVSPFMPGNIFKNSLATISTERGYLKKLGSEEARLRATGDLSEDKEKEYATRMEALQTDIAKQSATLQYGILDRLPAMAAGLPTGIGRFSSDSLTALNLGQAGFGFVASAGAISGRHARLQHDFAETMGAGDAYNPRSRTQDMNNGNNGNNALNEEAVNELKRIRQALERNMGSRSGGGSARPMNNMAPQAGAPAQGASVPFN